MIKILPLCYKFTPLIRQQAKSNCKQYFVILLFGIHGNGLAWTWTWTCVHMDMDLHGHGHGLGCPNLTVHPISQSSFLASQKNTWSLPPAQGSFEPPGGMKSPAVGVIWYTFWADVHVRVYMMAVSQCLCAPYEYTYVQCMLLEAVRHTPRYMSSKTAKRKTSYINKNINGVTFKK